MKGLFITFEGSEGCGKSTQLSRLGKQLREKGYRVRELREPGGTPVGEEIRQTLKHSHHETEMCPETELLLMNASRAQLVREVIRPALADGEIVLCDRFFDSTVAYQGYGRQLDLSKVQSIIDFAVAPNQPDLTLLLRIPGDLSRTRRARRLPEGEGWDRFESADHAFFERVNRGYEAIAAANPERVQPIDGAQGVEEVACAVWERVDALVRCHDPMEGH